MEVFEIPSHKSELNIDQHDFSKQDILSDLQEARKSSRDGPGFIIEHCKAYFAAICHCEKLPVDIIHMAFEDLHRGMKILNENLSTTLTNLCDEEQEDESMRLSYLNIMKLHIYCYTQIIITFEGKEEEKNMNNLKIKKKKVENTFAIDKKQIIVHLNNLLQKEIKILWNPPIVEEAFINLVSEVCYRFLQNAAIKNEKGVSTEIWSFLGTLIKSYNHRKTFVIRIVQLIKLHEHLVHCLPEGFRFLVENYNCKSMIHDIVQEVTEWQTDEKYQDAHGARFCSSLLVEMAILMPDMMIPEVMYLTRYLYYESPTLRNCVLSVITEVISKVLTKHDLTDEERESRDEFLAILEEHIFDTSPLVRSKIFQHWARLQKESAIPLKNQNEILSKAIDHLEDKGASVRKTAANLVTAFLSHNSFSFDLQLHKRQKDLEEIETELKAAETNIEEIVSKNAKELEDQWNAIQDEIKKMIEEEFEKEPEIERKDDEEGKKEEEDILDLVKMYLTEKDYRSAIKLCRMAEHDVQAWKELGETVGEKGKIEMTLLLLKSVFIKPKSNSIEELYRKFDLLGKKHDFLKDTVTFLKLLDSALEKMVELLETTTVGDMHEAIEFFITAYKFNIDRSMLGIVEMLRIMQRNEPERKNAIVNAFKKIYLETDSENLAQHTSVVVDRLIAFLKEVPINNLEDMQNIIAQWSDKGVIDNAVIDMFWQYFTGRVPTSEENKTAVLELLRMSAIHKTSIIKKNIKLIATIVFDKKEDKIQENMLMVGTACKALAVGGRGKIDMNSPDPPFKISADDALFQSLLEILATNFFKNVEYYSYVLPSSVACIYQLCSKPESVCEELIRQIVSTMISKNEKQLVDFQLVRLCQLLGCIAVSHLDYMDNTLYKELKRRQNMREKRENQKEKKDKKKTANKSRTHDSVLNQSAANEESTLEGAQAEDSDAEFILSILENDTVTGSGLLGKFSFIIKKVCQRPDLYDNGVIQGAAVVTLIRYMLVSSRFCEENMQLLFTIFEKTKYTDVKCTVLYHCSDLLTRFPNIVEPWTPRIYGSLQDPSDKIRKATFFTLSNLILRDMIRMFGYISAMAKCILDKDEELNTMSRNFFVQLSHKENNLYNTLPDIFSHLVEELETDDLRTIMKFLFDLMDKQKYMENLVERFCCKFEVTENINHCRNIVYCLTLINYNEKALRKLQENFPVYKHLMHDEEVYPHFKQILTIRPQVGKVDLKPIIAEIEQSIESLFEIREGENPSPPKRPVINAKKSAKKAPAPKRGRQRTKRKQQSSSDEDSD
ncbi:hypothetical protein HHI36_022001 [Cryptolaemus montrouzieri]|uniref:Condensin complex subunit 1 n=1 Tax=Cryptolaemus montrouzieri TaxID=559131 RepID=A0ABD2MYJ2_9CUCU